MDSESREFERMVWPHMRAAYNFARWLVRNSHDAEDVVQESFLKAYRSLDTFRGGDARVWILAIVRNTAMNFLRRRRPETAAGRVDPDYELEDRSANPELAMLEQSHREQVREAVSRLAPEFREVIVLREMEDLPYKEIASVLDIPIGTVMSRLARARLHLLEELREPKEVRHDLP